MSFSSFNLHPQVAAGVAALGYETPTPIQAQSIAPIMEGRDVLGLAQTGTGKTAAFVLPILNRLLPGPRGRLRALIVAPTRELAEQIHEAVTALGQRTGLRSTTVYGGVSFGPQAQRLRAGVDIVVACPGRLLDHMQQGTIRLSSIEVLVLDEADRMFDMGFLPGIRRIVAALPKERQTLLFSATMPDDIRRLVHEIQRQPLTVQVSPSAPVSTVAHALYPVPQNLKPELLLELLGSMDDAGSVLVFTRTKHRAKRLGERLERAGYKAASLQGNLSQNRRQEALTGFREGRTRILVATDIAARGIDVSSISHVVNFDMPDTTDAYTHRIGRTGRAARTGDAYTFVTREDEDMVRSIERVLGERIERRQLASFDYRKVAEAEAPRQPRPAVARSQARTPQAVRTHRGSTSSRAMQSRRRPQAERRPG
ncbi:MAG: DEAD/DEAH box helicase [Myxococcota bacterium]